MRLLSKHFYLWSSRFDWLLDVHRHSNRVSITAQRYSSRIFSVFSRSKLNKQILSRSKRKRRKKKGSELISSSLDRRKTSEKEREKKDSNSLETFKKARTGSNFLNPEFLIVLRPSLLQTNWRAIDHRVSESKKKKKTVISSDDAYRARYRGVYATFYRARRTFLFLPPRFSLPVIIDREKSLFRLETSRSTIP